MAQLRRDYSKFDKRNAEVVVIGPDSQEGFRYYWQRNQFPFIGLPDPEHKVLDLFGQEFSLFKLGRMPAQVIVDRLGMIRYVHYGSSMSDIPSTTEILDILDQLNQELENQPDPIRKP